MRDAGLCLPGWWMGNQEEKYRRGMGDGGSVLSGLSHSAPGLCWERRSASPPSPLLRDADGDGSAQALLSCESHSPPVLSLFPPSSWAAVPGRWAGVSPRFCPLQLIDFCAHTPTHSHTLTCSHSYSYMFTHTCAHTLTSMPTFSHSYIRTHTFTHTRSHTLTCALTLTFTHTHTHSHSSVLEPACPISREAVVKFSGILQASYQTQPL